MVKVEEKYGFPLFTKSASLVNLGKNQDVIISDIWSFWDYVIKKVAKDKKGADFLHSFLEQAKHFYQSAEDSPVKSQPLLYYYSFLNLSKIMINLKGTFGPNKRYSHGIRVKNPGANQKFTKDEIIKSSQKTETVEVAHELVSLFDTSMSVDDLTLNTKNILKHCVGIHRAYSEIYNQPEIFVRITSHTLYTQGKRLIFEAKLQCKLTQIAELTALGYEISTIDNEDVIYKESFGIKSYKPRRADYSALAAQLKCKGIWYLIGSRGYTMYLSTSAEDRYSQESIIYMMMFYLGSITRYHPYKFDKIFTDKEQWLVSEFLSTQPKQFLYLATANVLGQKVMKAYASF